MNSKNRNTKNLYTGIDGFKRGYQTRSNFLKNENVELLADSHILNRWKNYYQLLNAHRVSDVRQIKILTAESSVADVSTF
jgi:hypothetical protein